VAKKDLQRNRGVIVVFLILLLEASRVLNEKPNMKVLKISSGLLVNNT